ncbi:PREDICTED: lysosomal amino acid transporter 1 homolog [Ipomoea nil]|uniref:lysosomal amino acid transporter 1 homolog n=1 Tax=Ipomoea nil TaxID=35883 RepID=UPI0009011296|nr:PREDICTED: lysosomal amino acid transporter 1 homolog [Ipomoea nil]XP_019186955.1 PREDICTED: lysosomal amino acid transporter 1 homolog [Ipomoea nil]
MAMCGMGVEEQLQKCSQWALEYMDYCLCSSKDEVSLVLGALSVLSWAVAEVPQIMTNFREKSTEGLSCWFLLTWIIGDLCNIFGCLLEPATLPTQTYMAVFFTLTTFGLAGQALYYSHIYPRLKSNRRWHEVSEDGAYEKGTEHNGTENKKSNHVNGLKDGKSLSAYGALPSSPIPLPNCSPSAFSERDLYYMSARSLSMSHTPPVGSFPSHRTLYTDAEQDSVTAPLLGEVEPVHSPPAPKTKSMLCVASLLTCFLGGWKRHQTKSTNSGLILQKQAGEVVLFGRKLLQESGGFLLNSQSNQTIGIAALFGWGMAIIYIGGRLPQIRLNFRRGNVEGLNPLMFMFALFGNVTYVASILVSSLDWSKLGPNMPWLVDASGCVLLDTLILIQFFYYRNRVSDKVASKHENGSP